MRRNSRLPSVWPKRLEVTSRMGQKPEVQSTKVVQIANPSTVADGNFLVTCFCMVGSLLVSEDVIDP
jgi:hypothetical protein